jgi:hypothetical protein
VARVAKAALEPGATLELAAPVARAVRRLPWFAGTAFASIPRSAMTAIS